MQTPIEEHKVHSFHPKEDLALAKKLSERLRQKFGKLVKAIVLWQPEQKGYHHSDRNEQLVLSVILDDVTQKLDKHLLDQYVEAARTLVSQISPRFKIKNLRFSAYWKGLQSLNPEYTDILRNSIVLHDKGFVTPMQRLLHQGRIKPTYEAMGVYFARTQITMKNSTDHLLQSCVDLYWAAIDAAHALLMHHGYMPPSPKQVAHEMESKLVPRGIVTKADCLVMQEMFDLYKKITHKEMTRIDGHSYDAHLKKVQIFVNRIKKKLEE